MPLLVWLLLDILAWWRLNQQDAAIAFRAFGWDFGDCPAFWWGFHVVSGVLKARGTGGPWSRVAPTDPGNIRTKVFCAVSMLSIHSMPRYFEEHNSPYTCIACTYASRSSAQTQFVHLIVLVVFEMKSRNPSELRNPVSTVEE
jgi:hypothetical protein